MKRKSLLAMFLLMLVFTSLFVVGTAMACQKNKDKKPHPSHPEYPEHPVTPPPEVPPPHEQPPVGPPENNTVIIVINNTETIIVEQPKETIVVIKEVPIERPWKPTIEWFIGLMFILIGLTILAFAIAEATNSKDTYWEHKTVYYTECIDGDTHSFETTEVPD